MASFKLSKPYTMPVADLREAARGLADQLESEHGISQRWNGDAVRIKGKGVDGELDFSGGVIDISVKLGLMTSAFAPALKRGMQRYLDEHIY